MRGIGASWRGAMLVLGLGIAATATAATAAGGVATPYSTWSGKEGECLRLTDDPVTAENTRRLGLVLLGESDAKLGCVTFPYLGSPYDVPGINNAVHAGIDFRANDVDVHAVDAGRVLVASFDRAGNRSTLLIESNGRGRKSLYLHMSRMDVKQGDYVLAGQVVGRAGSVGACIDKPGGCPHLHFEVWPLSSPLYCSWDRAISGKSACAADGGTCSLARIQDLTISPESVITHPDQTDRPKFGKPSVTVADPVTFDGVGPVKVGAQMWQLLDELQENVVGSSNDSCDVVRLQSAHCGLSIMTVNGQVQRVDVFQGNYHTAEGIHIGSTAADLGKAYGKRLQSAPNEYNENARNMWVDGTVRGQRRGIVFIDVNGKVASFRAGDREKVGWIEGCL